MGQDGPGQKGPPVHVLSTPAMRGESLILTSWEGGYLKFLREVKNLISDNLFHCSATESLEHNLCDSMSMLCIRNETIPFLLNHRLKHVKPDFMKRCP